MDAQPDLHSDDFEIISYYSRAQAIDDGVLVDVSVAARETGLRFPVALTREVWNLCVAMTPAAESAGCDERGRLHDVLSMLLWAIRRSRRGCEVSFEVVCVTSRLRPTCIPLRAVAGPGDDAEPVITLMLPEQS